MNARNVAVFFVAVGFLAWNRLSDDGKPPETLVMVEDDDQEMEAARARALREVDSFIADLQAGNGTDFGVKVPVTDAGNVEHFWLTDVTYRDGRFSGRIGNEPGIVQNVKLGQDWSADKAEIDDWMFMRDGKMHGNYTLRPLLKRLPEDKAAKLRSMLAEP